MMFRFAIYLLAGIVFSARAQWSQPNGQYQPDISSPGIPGNPPSWTSYPGNGAASSPQYTGGSTWSTSNTAYPSSSPQVYQEGTPGQSGTSQATNSETTITETTDGPYNDPITNFTTDSTSLPTQSTTVSVDENFDGKPKKVVEATLLSSSSTDSSTTSSPVQADAPGSEMKVASEESQFQKDIIDEINKYRVMHGAAPVTINTDLSHKAKAWAQKMAVDDRESLDVNSQYGQLTFSGVPVPSIGTASVRHWYNRIKNYGWDNPKISTKSMQFTQLVWAASKEVGVGEATSNGGKSYVAALFSPAGNTQKDIVQNVLPVTGSGAGKRGPDSCPSGWHKFKKSCYRYFNNHVKWSEAVNLCDDEHSSLASLESVEEETSVRSMLATDEGTSAWIGLSDRVNPESKNLIWVDGNVMQYSNWNSYQDDAVSVGPKCATLSIATEGWMYKDCKGRLGFICKKRLKDIMTYLVVLTYPEKLWSDNLKSEASPRYMAMKKHLDQAIMNLYNDDDWFVDMLFEGFSPSSDDKVTAEFKLRFSPDGDAPTDPLEKLRTKLESTGLINGESLSLTNVSLQNGE